MDIKKLFSLEGKSGKMQMLIAAIPAAIAGIIFGATLTNPKVKLLGSKKR